MKMRCMMLFFCGPALFGQLNDPCEIRIKSSSLVSDRVEIAMLYGDGEEELLQFNASPTPTPELAKAPLRQIRYIQSNVVMAPVPSNFSLSGVDNTRRMGPVALTNDGVEPVLRSAISCDEQSSFNFMDCVQARYQFNCKYEFEYCMMEYEWN